MDVAEFEHWLGGIASLNEPQRRQAWQALALSEAADSGDVRPAVVDISTAGPAPAKAPAWPSQRAGAARVAELGQRRVDIVGCPHCERLAPLSLQGLPPHVQRTDEDALGPFAHEGQMGERARE